MELLLIALLVALAFGWLAARTRREDRQSDNGGNGSVHGGDADGACASGDGGACGDGGGSGD